MTFIMLKNVYITYVNMLFFDFTKYSTTFFIFRISVNILIV